MREGNGASEIVFCAPQGGYQRKSNFERRVWKRIRAKAGIPDSVVFHDLRHTHASQLLSIGTNVKVVQERLGHATIQITLDTYSHLMPGMQDAAMDGLESLIGPRKSEAS